MKIKRLILCAAAFLLFLSAPIFARDRVVDNAGLLTPPEKENLEAMMERVAAAYGFDLVIVTEERVGGAVAYADDFFDDNGYGLGRDRDGCLLLHVTGSREYQFSTSGRGMDLLDNNASAFGKLERDVVNFLRAGDPPGAYEAMVRDCEIFLALEAKDRRYNFFYEWNLVLVLAAWLFSLIIGFVIVGVWKAGMNTALPAARAAAYMIPGSLAFTQRRDQFLYSTFTQVRRETRPSSGGGGGIHMGSSGRSHGGRGGRY